MLNQRQLEIIMELLDNTGLFITASSMAKDKQVSLRTIQNDMKVIRDQLMQEASIQFETTSKGSRIVVKDETTFSHFKEEFFLNSAAMSDIQEDRINDLLLSLLEQYRSISMYQLESDLFVSHSTLVNDLKKVKDILGKYNLEVLRNANRITLDGSEINKRNCILERNLIISNTTFIRNDKNVSKQLDSIKDIIVQSFIDLKIEISDVDLSNLILLLYVTIERIKKGFYIQPYDLEITENLDPELNIAKVLFKRIENKFLLRITEEEINYLSLYLKGRGGYGEVVISNETDKIITEILEEIQETFGYNFPSDTNLRIALALHCDPLFIRIKYNMQLKNPLREYIRQEYPLGYELAVYFSDCLQKRFHKAITSDEVAFIAIYFYSSLMALHESNNGKKLLVISSNRTSENTLVRQTLFKWFSTQICDIRFINPKELEERPDTLDQYDVVATTEQGKFYDNGIALYINRFPTRNDYLNLKLALEGLKSLDNIISIFNKDLFLVVENGKKEEIIEMLCQKIEKQHEMSGLYDAVMQRESMRPSYFGNGFAAPHPITPLSSDTFVSICISHTPIEWDKDKNKVQMILLIGIGKNNYNAFHLWNYLSNIFSDRNFVKNVLEEPTYENVMKMLKHVFTDIN